MSNITFFMKRESMKKNSINHVCCLMSLVGIAAGCGGSGSSSTSDAVTRNVIAGLCIAEGNLNSFTINCDREIKNITLLDGLCIDSDDISIKNANSSYNIKKTSPMTVVGNVVGPSSFDIVVNFEDETSTSVRIE
jgi:hypothetical protein